MLRRLWIAVAFACVATAADPQTPAFDPQAWKASRAGPPTQVLTLGTAHLSQLKSPVNEGMMAALLDKLATFSPEIITVETVSGEQCDTLKRYAGLYPESFATWCKTTES